MSAIPESRLKRALWRADHRGTREADMLIGGFARRHLAQMTQAELDWFETLLEEQDVDIMAWALRTAEPPEQLQCPMMDRLMDLDYIRLAPR